MSRKRQPGPRSLSQMEEEEVQGIETNKKGFILFCILYPCALLFLYTSGIWDIALAKGTVSSTIDQIAMISAVIVPLMGAYVVSFFM